MKLIQSIEEFEQAIQGTCVVYFYTDWCPDCFSTKMYMPRLEDDYAMIEFYAINRDDLMDVAKHYKIFGIPSFLLFKKGELVGEFVNGNKKSYFEVKRFIDESM